MANILTINGGSSSLRFALFECKPKPVRLLAGKIERVGSSAATLTAARSGAAATEMKFDGSKPQSALNSMVSWMAQQSSFEPPAAIGHRVVHGMLRTAPEEVTPALLAALRDIAPYDPDHLPAEIALIEALQKVYSGIPHVACFDTAFHRSMPLVASQLPIPRRYAAQGIQRFGFHGLSYTYLMQELMRLSDPAADRGAVILAHLGNGASLAAVRNGRSVDTSMGFTPTSGLVMGTRSGDLDPGLMSYLAIAEDIGAEQFRSLVNHESGLLGVSEISADVRDLLAAEAVDPRAREALALFCYQAKKWIGSFAAVLGGVDTLVFAGGVGENAAPLRQRICDGLQFLGIEIDGSRNEQQAARISTDAGRVAVRVIRTDEESVIADLTARLMGLTT
jgi:acetate kinase